MRRDDEPRQRPEEHETMAEVDAGAGGGTGSTDAEIGAHGGGAPGAQAAELKREHPVEDERIPPQDENR